MTFTFTQRVVGRKVHGRCVAPTRSNRHGHTCKRTVTRGVLSVAATRGLDKLAFQGVLSRSKRLSTGVYTAQIVAISHGLRSTTRSLTFTIVK